LQNATEERDSEGGEGSNVEWGQLSFLKKEIDLLPARRGDPGKKGVENEKRTLFTSLIRGEYPAGIAEQTLKKGKNRLSGRPVRGRMEGAGGKNPVGPSNK